MSNVIQFRPVSGKSRKFSDIRQMERNKLYMTRDLERNRPWWARFRSKLARLFGSCTASPNTSGQISASTGNGSAA